MVRHRIIGFPLTQSALAIAIGLGLWWLIVQVASPSVIVLPSPARVWSAAYEMARQGFQGQPLAENVVMTVRRVGLGMALAVAVGIPVGIAMGSYSPVRAALTPGISLFRPVPPFAWLAIFVVWFGIGELPKVLIIFVGSVTVVALSTMDGVRRVPPHFVEAGAALGANRWQLFRHVVTPAALPQILTGIRAAFLLAWTAVIAAEYVAAKAGLGTIILDASSYLRTDQTFVGIIAIGVCGGATDWLVGRAQRAIAPWGNR
jgi:taurine transport system permease protein